MGRSEPVVTRRTHIAGTMVFAGAALMAVGLLGPTAGAGEGFTACPAGTEKLVKFESPNWEEPEDKSVEAVTLTDADDTGGSWTSLVPIAAVVVKGASGDDSLDIIEYDPPATSGSYTNANLLNNGGNVPDISFVEFCTAEVDSTTTTTGASTTTTGASTTTTEASTTTTEASTTTTEASTTTTTATALVAGETETATSTTIAPAQVAGETQELPRTGTPANVLALLGAAMILGGVSIMGATRRRLASGLRS